MMITRTPMRASIGRGGTDLPACYERRGGILAHDLLAKLHLLGRDLDELSPDIVRNFQSHTGAAGFTP
jgi:hypothetical protein